MVTRAAAGVTIGPTTARKIIATAAAEQLSDADVRVLARNDTHTTRVVEKHYEKRDRLQTSERAIHLQNIIRSGSSASVAASLTSSLISADSVSSSSLSASSSSSSSSSSSAFLSTSSSLSSISSTTSACSAVNDTAAALHARHAVKRKQPDAYIKQHDDQERRTDPDYEDESETDTDDEQQTAALAANRSRSRSHTLFTSDEDNIILEFAERHQSRMRGCQLGFRQRAPRIPWRDLCSKMSHRDAHSIRYRWRTLTRAPKRAKTTVAPVSFATTPATALTAAVAATTSLARIISIDGTRILSGDLYLICKTSQGTKYYTENEVMKREPAMYKTWLASQP